MRISDWSSDVFSSDLTPHHGAPMLRSMAAHNRRELIAAVRARADLVFLSPVFATRSHPGAPTLGPLRFGLTARRAGIPIIALGGMTSHSYHRLKPLGADGSSAIDAWLFRPPPLPGKHKAGIYVPTPIRVRPFRNCLFSDTRPT